MVGYNGLYYTSIEDNYFPKESHFNRSKTENLDCLNKKKKKFHKCISKQEDDLSQERTSSKILCTVDSLFLKAWIY